MQVAQDEAYLLPYRRAARRHGAAFESLLWACRETQQARFDAIRRIYPPDGKSLLDAGCGRADLMGHLLEAGVRPARYIGLEAVDELADAAQARNYPDSRIIRGDFVRQPESLLVGADVIVFCGSLNTMDQTTFYATLRNAADAAGEAVIFNFLCSPALAARDYLVWHTREIVLSIAGRLAPQLKVLSDYLHGDCTVAMLKTPSLGRPT